MQFESITLVYIPVFYGGRQLGAAAGPACIQATGLTNMLIEEGIKVDCEIQVNVPAISSQEPIEPSLRFLDEIKSLCEHTAKVVEECLSKKSMPILIGGDHSFAIGSIAGASNYYRKMNQSLGVFWFDAHGDMNTQASTSSGNIHGMPLACSLGYGSHELTNILNYQPKILAKHTSLIGLRDVDKLEKEIINMSAVPSYTMFDIDRLGISHILDESLSFIAPKVGAIHVSFDLDAIDPDFAPGVSTPVPGGLSLRESLQIMTYLSKNANLCSIDIAEFNPLNDVKNKTGRLACDLILTCLGKNML